MVQGFLLRSVLKHDLLGWRTMIDTAPLFAFGRGQVSIDVFGFAAAVFDTVFLIKADLIITVFVRDDHDDESLRLHFALLNLGLILFLHIFAKNAKNGQNRKNKLK